MTTLIVGCGYVGTALARSLLASGENVIAVRRSAPLPDPEITSLVCDASDRRALVDASRTCSHLRVVQAAVFCASPSRSGKADEAAYRSVYLDAVASVLDALHELGAPLRNALITTSTAVYGQEDGAWVNEESATETRGNAAILEEGEALLTSRVERAVALRLSGIYGPGRDRMIRSVTDQSARLPRESVWTNRIHRDDAAGAIAHLLAIEASGVFIGTDDEPAELSDVYRWLAKEMNTPVPPLGDDWRAKARGNKRASNRKLRATGWSPTYPSFREGYRSLLGEQRPSASSR